MSVGLRRRVPSARVSQGFRACAGPVRGLSRQSELVVFACCLCARSAPVTHMAAEDFYVRYYVGHKGKFGHEFLEFELRPDGKVTHIF